MSTNRINGSTRQVYNNRTDSNYEGKKLAKQKQCEKRLSCESHSLYVLQLCSTYRQFEIDKTINSIEFVPE